MTTITVTAARDETTRSFTLHESSIIGFEMDYHDAFVWVTQYDTRKDAENALQLHARDFDEKGWTLADGPLPVRDLGPERPLVQGTWSERVDQTRLGSSFGPRA